MLQSPEDQRFNEFSHSYRNRTVRRRFHWIFSITFEKWNYVASLKQSGRMPRCSDQLAILSRTSFIPVPKCRIMLFVIASGPALSVFLSEWKTAWASSKEKGLHSGISRSSGFTVGDCDLPTSLLEGKKRSNSDFSGACGLGRDVLSPLSSLSFLYVQEKPLSLLPILNSDC